MSLQKVWGVTRGRSRQNRYFSKKTLFTKNIIPLLRTVIEIVLHVKSLNVLLGNSNSLFHPELLL